MQRNRISFDQRLLLEKYQLIVKAYNRIGIKLVKPNPEGLCFGLNANYIKFAHKGKREEFLRYLEFVAFVDEKTLATALNDYATNNDSVVTIGTETFQLSKLENLLESIQSHQESQVFRAKWNRTYSFICPKDELSHHLKTAGISNGSFMAVSFGIHVFTIEKTQRGFYVFEANNIKKHPKLLATEEEVAQEIIENLNITNVFILSPDRVAFFIQFLSPENDCAFDDAITAFADIQTYPSLASLISLYRSERISRDDLALALWDEIKKINETIPVNTGALACFVEELGKYIKEQNFTGAQEQYSIESSINDTAYVFGVSLLYLAAMANQIRLVKKLLASGTNPDIRGQWMIDPVLYNAAARQYLEVMSLLLAYKANPNLLADDGSTPLLAAAARGHSQAVEMLLENNADPDQARTKDGATPLCIAAQKGDEKVVEALLKKANPDLSINGYPPLFDAASRGHLQVVRTLLHKANPNLPSKDGATPLFIAAQKGFTKIVETLLEKANPDLAILNGETPLFVAAQRGNLQVVKALLAKKADPCKARRDGVTPLDMAKDPQIMSALFGIKLFDKSDADTNARVNSQQANTIAKQ